MSSGTSSSETQTVVGMAEKPTELVAVRPDLEEMTHQRLPNFVGISAETARRYALSLPISSLVCGIQSRENLQQDLAIARNFTPMTEDEVREQLAHSKPFAADGKIELYKTGNFGCDWHHEQESG